VASPPRPPPTANKRERHLDFNRTLRACMVLRIIGTVGLSSKHGDCLDFVVLGRLKQYLKDLADADREAFRLLLEHGSRASKVIAADIEVARKQGDAATAHRLKHLANAIAAIEASPAALLHH
jgi:hypothetical protein